MSSIAEIPVDAEHALTPFRYEDKPFLVAYLNDREVYERTLRIPFPYTASDAEDWLAFCERIDPDRDHQIVWAIRRRDGRLVGGCGLEGFCAPSPHMAELGYWLAKPYWGQGIVTATVAALVKYAKEELKLLRLTAHVFADNDASARVLEKNEFKLEGRLRKHYYKDGAFKDSLLYARLLDE